MTSFSHIVHEFVDSSNVGFYMIHLERATERIPHITALQTALNAPLNIFPGAEGAQLVANGHPTLCIRKSGKHRSAGDIGCTVSHILICREALEKGYSHIVIFEDDCQMTGSLSDINNILTHAKKNIPAWDLFILDGCLYKSTNISDKIKHVHEFWKTHAVILSRFFMEKLIQLYELYYAEGYTFAIDGIYSDLLGAGTCTGYGTAREGSLFMQKPGFSYILNR